VLNLKSFLFKDNNDPHDKQAHDTWYYEALEDCADGHWEWNVSKGELYISRKLRELIGYSEEETKHSPLSWWLEKVHPEDQVEVKRKFEELTYSKSKFSYFDDFRFLCKNGDYIWLENHAKMLHDRDGKLMA